MIPNKELIEHTINEWDQKQYKKQQAYLYGPYSTQEPKLDASYEFLKELIAFEKTALAEGEETFNEIFDAMEYPKSFSGNELSLNRMNDEQIFDQFETIQDLSKRAMLETNDPLHQTFVRRNIKRLTIRLMHKLKAKGKLEKKGKKTMIG